MTSYTASPPDNTIRAFRDEVLAAINVKNLIDVRSPDEFSGKILAPRTCRRNKASGPDTFLVPSTCRGAGPPTRTAPSSPMRSWLLYADAGLDNSKETIAYCRIGGTVLAHLVRAAGITRHQNVKNYDGS